MDKLDIYNNSAIILKRTTPKSIISWITILIILSILILIFIFIPFKIYNTSIGSVIVEENKCYISLNSSDFPIIKDNNLYIRGKKYDYEVVYIENDNVLLKIDLEDNIRINNNKIIVNFLKDRTTVFNILKSKIKERW